MSHFALRRGRLATTVFLLLLAAALPCAAAPSPTAGDQGVLPAPTPRGEIAPVTGGLAWETRSTTAEARARIAAAPADPVGYLDLAAAAWRAGDTGAAARALEEGRRKATPSAPLLVELGRAYVALNRLADAEEAVQAALVIDPEVPGGQLQLGRVYGLIDWPLAAIECFERAVAQSPRDVSAQCALVEGLLAANRAPAAEKQCREFLSAGEGHAALWVSLGETLEAQEQLRDAFDAYGRALVADATHAGAHARRGRLFCRFGQFDAAATECRAALATDPDNALAHAYLGIAYSYQGQAEAAREHVLRAQAAGLNMEPALKRLAQ